MGNQWIAAGVSKDRGESLVAELNPKSESEFVRCLVQSSPLVKPYTTMYWCDYPVGFLDEMLTIFDDYNHPVVLIGGQALCWMAVRLDTGQVCLLD
jgi:hypothetical protein